MQEDGRIVRALQEAHKAGKRTALATVVRVVGSAYRPAGAKMLIDEDGKATGMISGGCLESDVVETARYAISEGISVVKGYHLDEDVVWGLGLGCPGTVEIFIEPVQLEETGDSGLHETAFAAWMHHVQGGVAGVLITVWRDHRSEPGELTVAKRLVTEHGLSIGNVNDDQLNVIVTELAQQKLQQLHPLSETRVISVNDRQFTVFFDVYIPPCELMIFGAGHDAIPLVRLAYSLGWQATVIDPRSAFNSEQRFPNARRLVVDGTHLTKRLLVGRRTYVVIMNHHFERDQVALQVAMESNSPYVGLLGPYSRRTRLLDALAEKGIHFCEQQLKRLYSPVGLDIGADCAEEIAVSIIGEILAVSHGHSGGSLRGHRHIHRPKNELVFSRTTSR